MRRDLTARAGDRLAGVARPAVLAGWMLLVVVGLGLAGCSGVEPVAPYSGPITDPGQLYARLTLDYRALTLSTAPGYNTWQVTATPRSAGGGAMTGLPAPTYTSPDTTSVRVTADGQLTAVGTGTLIKIIADLTVGNVRHADTAYVTVKTLASPPKLESISINPSSDSGIRPISGNGISNSGSTIVLNLAGFTRNLNLVPRALDTAGAVITGLPFEYQVLDSDILKFSKVVSNNGATPTPLSIGRTRIVIWTTAYGITKTDTMAITTTMPIFSDIAVQSAGDLTAFTPSEVHIRSGGVIFWFNRRDVPVDVTFDDPASALDGPASVCSMMDAFSDFEGPAPHCTGPGDFTLDAVAPALLIPTVKIRRFLVPGVYPYHSTLTGATGRIIVSDVAS